MKTLNLLIGVQARSSSKRFPSKIFEYIGQKMVIDHVMESCMNAARHVSKYNSKVTIVPKVVILCPQNDSDVLSLSKKYNIFEGPEDDVLTRYTLAAYKTEADYIVRITSDCPLIPPFVISKHINTAIQNDIDYLSNVDPRVRTTFDGADCEVMSKRLLEWLHVNSNDVSDREHVTAYIRKSQPDWSRIGHIINFIDLSNMKLSLDTREDLARIKENYNRVDKSMSEAKKIFGNKLVFRL